MVVLLTIKAAGAPIIIVAEAVQLRAEVSVTV